MSRDSTGRPGQGCGVKSQQLRGQPAGTFPGSGDQAPERHAWASGPRLIRGGTEGPRCQAAGAWASDPEGRPVGSRPLPGRHRARSGGGAAPPVTGRTTRAALRPERGSLSSRAWCARSGRASLGSAKASWVSAGLVAFPELPRTMEGPRVALTTLGE